MRRNDDEWALILLGAIVWILMLALGIILWLVKWVVIILAIFFVLSLFVGEEHLDRVYNNVKSVNNFLDGEKNDGKEEVETDKEAFEESE